ncbi:MAG TPA: arginyltransferase, partial [Desulfopila sp.]|nr:arginyltransferase [Desulfopila sp.]
MSKYDQKCALEFSTLKKRVDKYFVDVTVNCPYQLPYPATFYQGLFGPLSDRMMELFLAAGYRRNGNSLYAMHCRNCSACIPIRL